MSLLWLILKILPLLLIVAAVFYRLGVKSVRREVAKAQQDKQHSVEREQLRTDETVQKLKEVEDQLSALTVQHEQLERSAVPRRKLNEAEARNNFLEKEIARLESGLPASTVKAPAPAANPAPAPSVELIPEPTPEPAPPPVSPPTAPPEPETLTLSSPPAKLKGDSVRRSRKMR